MNRFPWYRRSLVLYLVVVALVVVLVTLFRRGGEIPKVVPVVEEPAAVVNHDAFGIQEALYDVSSGSVRSGHTLSTILSGLGLRAAEIDAVARRLSDVYNPRRIRAGQKYHGYLTRDSLQELRHFVFETSALNYFVIHFGDSMYVREGEREVRTVSRETAGLIQSSLWNTLSAQGLGMELAIRMSEILAWEVDFYRIQTGDAFKVVYDENYIDDQPVGIPRVEAVYFSHRGREIYGFHFVHDTIDGFFHPNGDNLRKVFLKAPLEFGRISSRYSHSRLHPIHRDRRPHYGTDYAAPHGTPILAVGDGVVTAARYTSGNGNYVRIRHNSVYETQYLHMSRFARGIRPGTQVKQGEVIGYVGSTGLATGPHVCFRFWKNGQQVDHLRE